MTKMHCDLQSVTAFAPATCANVIVGFDILGFALEKMGDTVTLTKRHDRQIKIETINSQESLPMAIEKNTASVVIQKVCDDLRLEVGFSIKIDKGIPLSSGLGGSAASAVAALTALNAFLSSPLSKHELARYALFGEEVASGQQHGDNVIPSLFGGFTLIRSLKPIQLIHLPIPDIDCAFIHPQLQVQTKEARNILKAEVTLKEYTTQSTHLASFLAALYQNDMGLLRASLTDDLIEHQRAAFVPGFYKIKEAAMAAGAMGVSFSGSGPSIVALAQQPREAESICLAMQAALESEKIRSSAWVSKINHQAAHVTQFIKGDACIS